MQYLCSPFLCSSCSCMSCCTRIAPLLDWPGTHTCTFLLYGEWFAAVPRKLDIATTMLLCIFFFIFFLHIGSYCISWTTGKSTTSKYHIFCRFQFSSRYLYLIVGFLENEVMAITVTVAWRWKILPSPPSCGLSIFQEGLRPVQTASWYSPWLQALGVKSVQRVWNLAHSRSLGIASIATTTIW